MEERDTQESLYFQLEQMERIFKRLDPHLFLSWVNSGHTVPGQDPTLLFNKSFCAVASKEAKQTDCGGC